MTKPYGNSTVPIGTGGYFAPACSDARQEELALGRELEKLYQFAPHLRHEEIFAFFAPHSFLTNLPKLPGAITTGGQSRALLHEATHYRQAVTTFFGIYRFLTRLRTLSYLGILRTKARGREVSAAEVDLLRGEHRANEQLIGNLSTKYTYASADHKDTTGEASPFFGFAALPGGERAPAYFKSDIYNQVHMYFITPRLLEESMAMCLELAYGYGQQSYDIARMSFDPEAFQYAAAVECLRLTTGWTDLGALACAGYCLCDFALNHVTPAVAFLYGVQIVRDAFSSPVTLDNIGDIYACLSERLEFAEVAETRNDIYANLRERVQRLEGAADDLFDGAILAMLQTMNTAIVRRAADASYFSSMALRTMADTEFMNDFTPPLIYGGGEVATYDATDQRSRAVLFLSCAFHRLMEYLDKGGDDPSCPMYHMRRACPFERTSACALAPWMRFPGAVAKEKLQVCTYKYVDHAFESAPNGAN
jgi:hypothetical protein